MTEVFRIALSCMLDQDGFVDFPEVERLLVRACGYRWVATPDWRFEEPPHPGVPCVPVIVLRRERDALLSPVDGRTPVLSEVVIGEAEVRQWRHACFQRCPFPQPNGDHLPWEVVRFDLADGGAIFHRAVASLMEEPWAVDGDALFVSPRDALPILQMQSPANFRYRGRASLEAEFRGLIGDEARRRLLLWRNSVPEFEWVNFQTVESLIASLKSTS